MVNVLIYGAGSIGNHLAHACRAKKYNVTIVDIDTDALRRTRDDIYPSRYGSWDDKINLQSSYDLEQNDIDVVVIGTPPDTHNSIAINVLKNCEPKVILIEKPLCTPDLSGYASLKQLADSKQTTVLVGYNHIHTANTHKATELIKEGVIGEVLSITVRWIEHWGGIFGAHPWLEGPKDSYLGYYKRGGGACGEHSHGINIFQYFSNVCNKGKISKVSSLMDIVHENEIKYDRNCLINVATESGLIGSIAQDVITEPSEKMVRIQGENGFVEWHANYQHGNFDAVIEGINGKEPVKHLFEKSRPDDFIGEIEEVDSILKGLSEGSTISLATGYETMKVIEAAFLSNETGTVVTVEY